MATNCPREVCEAVSVAQTGVIAFRMPVPIPFRVRAQNIQLAFWEEHCNVAPMMAQTEASAIVLIRPYLSPNQPPMKEPTNVPGR